MANRVTGNRPIHSAYGTNQGSSFWNLALKAGALALFILSGQAAAAQTFNPRNLPEGHRGFEPGFQVLTGQGHKAELLCYQPPGYFKDLLVEATEENRPLAEYYLGRYQACSQTKGEPTFISLEEDLGEFWAERDARQLEGLARMYKTGALEVLYPKVGQSFDDFFRYYIRYRDVGSEYYDVDRNCYYFTTGTLLCRNKQSFEKLRSRFPEV